MPGPGQMPPPQKGAHERMAIEQLQKLVGRAGRKEPIISGADVALPQETPGMAERRLYGGGPREDVNLPVEPPASGLSGLWQSISGLWGGQPRERKMTPEEIASENAGNVYGFGQPRR